MPTRTHNPDKHLLKEHHMTIVQLEGRYYPVQLAQTKQGEIQLDCWPHYTWDFEDAYTIPPAVGPRHTTGVVSFARRAAAVEFCLRSIENDTLLFRYLYDEAYLRLPVHPERLVWYSEEIWRLTGREVYTYVLVDTVRANICYRQGEYWSATAPSIDEAVMQLYDLVVERLQQPAQVS